MSEFRLLSYVCHFSSFFSNFNPDSLKTDQNSIKFLAKMYWNTIETTCKLHGNWLILECVIFLQRTVFIKSLPKALPKLTPEGDFNAENYPFMPRLISNLIFNYLIAF